MASANERWTLLDAAIHLLAATQKLIPTSLHQCKDPCPWQNFGKQHKTAIGRSGDDHALFFYQPPVPVSRHP